MLEIKNLHAEAEGKEILKGVSLKIEDGESCALMGPNGSGKSSLAQVLMGNPKYKITSGEIIYNGEDISNLKPDEKARRGLFLSFQYPVEMQGISMMNFLRASYNSINEQKLSILEFQKMIEEKAKELNLNEEFLSRNLNEGFSGGEKKKAEILQMLALNPKTVILDETDSGLDIDSLKIVSKGVKNFVEENKNEKSALIITHYRRILDYLNPDKVFVMKDGRIAADGGKELIDEIEEKGYGGLNGK